MNEETERALLILPIGEVIFLQGENFQEECSNTHWICVASQHAAHKV
jgi:hypothetical protein